MGVGDLKWPPQGVARVLWLIRPIGPPSMWKLPSARNWYEESEHKGSPSPENGSSLCLQQRALETSFKLALATCQIYHRSSTKIANKQVNLQRVLQRLGR